MTVTLPERLMTTRVIEKGHPIEHTIIVKADNVFDYINRVREDRSQLVNVAPPFDNLFIQFNIDPNERAKNPAYDLGIHIQSRRVKTSDVEWVLDATLWCMPATMINNANNKPLVSWFLEIDASGKVKTLELSRNEQFWVGNENGYPGYKQFIAGALFAINLMNCKNVILEEQPLSSHESRMEKKHGKKPFRYHLLKVRSGKKVYDLERTMSNERGEYSTHIRRGHFKTYTDEAPLMGRFVGTYWWEAAVIGRDNAHVVDKDYEVEL